MQLDKIPGLGITLWLLAQCPPHSQRSSLGQNPPIWGMGQLVWMNSVQAKRGLAPNAVPTGFLCFPEKLESCLSIFLT